MESSIFLFHCTFLIPNLKMYFMWIIFGINLGLLFYTKIWIQIMLDLHSFRSVDLDPGVYNKGKIKSLTNKASYKKTFNAVQ